MHGPGRREYDDIVVEEVPGSHAKAMCCTGRWGPGPEAMCCTGRWGPGPEALRYARRHHRCPLAPRGWVDCNVAGRAHDWGPNPELRAVDRAYWRCRNCPVSTMTKNREAEALPSWTKNIEYVPALADEKQYPVIRPLEVLP